MTHSLRNVHRCGHLYRPGGHGELELDPAQFAGMDTIIETLDLPGFTTERVTYMSHHFWIHFQKRDVLIRVHHGAGWEVWQGDAMLARALRGYGDDRQGLFLLCWYLIDNAYYAQQAGFEKAAAVYRTAFAEGRLKKRKVRNSASVRVWITEAT